jgi:protein-tyrosine-phosphatase
VAEALFRHHYKGDSVRVRSAGLAIDIMHPYVARAVHDVMLGKSVSLRDDGAVKLESFLLKWADKLIIVADNVSPDMFRDREMIQGKPVTFWNISDASDSDAQGIRRRVDDIEKNVLELIKTLN